jgi:hypothetical protein
LQENYFDDGEDVEWAMIRKQNLLI